MWIVHRAFPVWFLGAVILLLGWAGASENGDFGPSPPRGRAVDFRRDVYPILYARCFKCHTGTDAPAGYRLDDRDELLGQGETNGEPLVVAGESRKSRLIERVSAPEAERMPPEGEGDRVPPDEVKTLRAWIDQGLTWDDTLLPPVKEKNRHWAFQPVTAPDVPQVKNTGWVHNPVDAFIAGAHESHGLAPSPEASRRVLIRRLTLDLTGLPPTPEEVTGFLDDKSPYAYEKLVERLLASPRYGERWGRHWLDLARWADSEGYEINTLRPSTWRYRDYVIRSFNRDKPYDRFLREQIAGDELVPYSDENLIATGFLGAARLSINEEDRVRQRNDVLVDIVNATASVTLGLTMGCAQCHDHKFDPITQKDYYRLQGFFVRGQPGHVLLKKPELWQAYEDATRPERELLQATDELRRLLTEPVRTRLVEEARKMLTPAQREALTTPADQRTAAQKELAEQAEKLLEVPDDKLVEALERSDRKLLQELRDKTSRLEKDLTSKKPQVWAYYSPATSPHAMDVIPYEINSDSYFPYEPEKIKQARAHLLERGDVHELGMELTPGWPEVLGLVPAGENAPATRLDLVDWLTSPAHPLTSRVWVNYVWQQHFGRGLVATTGDLGLRGARPTHPALLDWLARELVQTGWSTKHLHRLLVLSNTYRQAARPDSPSTEAANQQADPDNRFLWHWSPRRLDAEAIRDAIVFISGTLDLTAGGPSASFGASAAADGGELDPTYDGYITASKEPPARPRRSVYMRQLRDNFPVMQELFDGATTNESCSRRYVTTVPSQPLYLLNNPFILEQAEAFATRVLARAGDDEARQIEAAFLLALSRPPDPADRQAVREFLDANERATPQRGEGEVAQKTDPEQPPLRLVHLCHAILNLNEFLYLP